MHKLLRAAKPTDTSSSVRQSDLDSLAQLMNTRLTSQPLSIESMIELSPSSKMSSEKNLQFTLPGFDQCALRSSHPESSTYTGGSKSPEEHSYEGLSSQVDFGAIP